MSANEGLVPLDCALKSILDLSSRLSISVYVVGGVVRDLVSGHRPGDYDLDIVIEGNGIDFARELKLVLGGESRSYPSFFTAKLLSPFFPQLSAKSNGPLLHEIDIASARSETYESSGALPKVTLVTIDRDLLRRDFTINAMALPLSVYADVVASRVEVTDVADHVLDPTSGRIDLEKKALRVLHPQSFIDDPTRLFRAVRYLVRLGLRLSDETQVAFNAAVSSGATSALSEKRIWNEIVASLDEREPHTVLKKFCTMGLLSTGRIVDGGIIELVCSRLKRLSRNESISPSTRKEAGKLVVLHTALADGRRDAAKSLQEGRRVLERAENLLTKQNNVAAEAACAAIADEADRS